MLDSSRSIRELLVSKCVADRFTAATAPNNPVRSPFRVRRHPTGDRDGWWMHVRWGIASIALPEYRSQHVGDMFRSDSARILSAYFAPVHGPHTLGSHVGPARSAQGREESDPASQGRANLLDSELRDFLVHDDEGLLGVVDEVRADGTILVSCGWFGRRYVVLSLEDIEEIHFADRELVLRSGVPRVEEAREGAGTFARLLATLVGRSLGRNETSRRSH